LPERDRWYLLILEPNLKAIVHLAEKGYQNWKANDIFFEKNKQ
jgi:hypothetical protein